VIRVGALVAISLLIFALPVAAATTPHRRTLKTRARMAPPLASPSTPAAISGGTHVRIVIPGGPVHLYRPRGYNRRTAGIVVYVHGYYLHVDQAWKEHNLESQFAASHRNALFIAPEAPAAAEEKPAWTDLGDLIKAALRSARLRAPGGPLIVVGHSGAYRTIVPWLEETSLHSVILIDALYGNEAEFRAWLDKSAVNQMTLVVKGTAKAADPFVRALPYALTLPKIPLTAEEFSRDERAAKLLCLRSQYGHFELITEGNALPVLLARTPLPLAAKRPHRRPR
jgi:hypothetical protein